MFCIDYRDIENTEQSIQNIENKMLFMFCIELRKQCLCFCMPCAAIEYLGFPGQICVFRAMVAFKGLLGCPAARGAIIRACTAGIVDARSPCRGWENGGFVVGILTSLRPRPPIRAPLSLSVPRRTSSLTFNIAPCGEIGHADPRCDDRSMTSRL